MTNTHTHMDKPKAICPTNFPAPHTSTAIPCCLFVEHSSTELGSTFTPKMAKCSQWKMDRNNPGQNNSPTDISYISSLSCFPLRCRSAILYKVCNHVIAVYSKSKLLDYTTCTACMHHKNGDEKSELFRFCFFTYFF